MRELKEKHATETGALLAALFDSQRTTRMLRTGNGELRERLEQLERLETKNEGLRRAVGELNREVAELRVQLTKAGDRLGTWSWVCRRRWTRREFRFASHIALITVQLKI